MNFDAGGKSGALIRTRKQAVMAVRLLILVILALTLIYHAPEEGAMSSRLLLMLGLFAASNVVFWFVERQRFESRRSYSLILLFDVGMVSLVAAFLGERNPEFFIVFLLTVLAAALSHRVSLAVLVSVAASVVFVVLQSSGTGSQTLLTQAFFLRLNLLFVTALLAGYITEAMDAERRIAMQCNPTTGLPGYSLIRAELERRISSGGKFAVCYIDNDNFKAYNDHYGYARGDDLIKATGAVIVNSVRKVGNRNDFIGHVGGDDFLVVTTPDRVDALVNQVSEKFSGTVLNFYDTAALERGFIKSHDRKGVTAIFPVMTLSIAVISNEKRKIESSDQIARIAAKLKKRAKSHKSRRYVTGDTTIVHEADIQRAMDEKRIL
jgi:diguanylate cyclase (GGDEF)-like protein